MRLFRPVYIPQNVHPLVQRLFIEMNRQQIGILDLAERAGIGRDTINGWKKKSTPNLANLDACFGVLGMSLQVAKGRRAASPSIAPRRMTMLEDTNELVG